MPQPSAERNTGSLVRRLRRRWYRDTCQLLYRQPATISAPSGLISFTFDDFPRSAGTVGREILDTYGARGTYYTCMALAGIHNHLGALFQPEDLLSLSERGHEIACHTHRHIDLLPRRPAAAIAADMTDNAIATRRILPAYHFQSFAYPYGNARPAAKRQLSSHFLSCRGIVPGIIAGRFDRAFLPANELTDQANTAHRAEQIIQRAVQNRGWAIFFTHDVSEQPSAFGCTPQLLEHVIAAAAAAGCLLLPVNEAMTYAMQPSINRAGGV